MSEALGRNGFPTQYAVKGNDHIRHIDKTRQDHQPASERQRVKDWHQRLKNARAHRANDKLASEMETPEFEAALSAVDGLILASMQGNI